jgi:hypothetical protein
MTDAAVLAGVVQMTSTADVARNLAAAASGVGEAVRRGAVWVGLPENVASMGPEAGKLALAASAVSMVAGGALVIALVGQHRLIGVGVLVAGLIALATLLPRVQGWVGQRAGGTAGLQVAPAVQREEEPA